MKIVNWKTTLDELSDPVRNLARYLAPAVSIEPELIRALRIKLFPNYGAELEADLWFSPLVSSRNAASISFHLEVVQILREQLINDWKYPEKQKKLKEARKVLAAVHKDISPALALREQIEWQTIEGNKEAVNQSLARIFLALDDDNRKQKLLFWFQKSKKYLPKLTLETSVGSHLNFLCINQNLPDSVDNKDLKEKVKQKIEPLEQAILTENAYSFSKIDKDNISLSPIELIITALTEGLAAASKDAASNEIKAAYKKLRGLILSKFGNEEDVSIILRLVEKKPDSYHLKEYFREELEESGAAQDSEFIQQTKAFLALLQQHGLLEGSSYQAEVHGNGNVVQGDNNVIGSHGEVSVGRDVSGDVYVKNVTNIAPELDWETGYLNSLIAHCDPLDLSPIDETRSQSSDAAETIRISDVFTTLYLDGVTRYPNQSVAEALASRKDSEFLRAKGKEALLIPALGAIAELQRLVILGKPGSGKTTLVNHLATQLAYQCLDKTDKTKKLPGWTDKIPTLPVRIILRRFAAWLPTDVHQGICGQVWNYLEHRLEEWGCKEAFIPLKQKLFEKGGVIIFDGLDEVRQTDAETKRTIIKEAIAEFSKTLSKCKIIITCREYAYQKGDAWRLPEADFPEVRLALFAAKQIEAFTQTWYRTVGPLKGWGEDKCQIEADHLNSAIEALPHLQELAPYPLLLTLMAQVHGRDGNLPEDRADLYEKATNLLLSHWENRIVRDIEGNRKFEPGLIVQLGVRAETLRAALERAAFDAHERQEKESSRGEQCADIPKEDLRDILKIELGSWDKAETVIDYIQTRAGLLQAEDHRTYRFPNRIFQEYLAATHILKQGEFDTLLRDRVRRDLNWWREVFLLAAEASRLTPRNISDMVGSLLPEKPQGKMVTPEQAAQAQLAAQALHETDFTEHVRKKGSGRYAQVFECIQSWLLIAMVADEALSPKERAASGNALNWLGDPRPGVGVVLETGLPDIEFCLVPRGSFWMGSENGNDSEKPPHLNECLDYDYWIARHPVTVAQFCAFVEESGHQPENEKCLKGLGNNPVVHVTWHEAQAFCRWLSEVWRAEEGETVRLPEGYAVRLPSEAEWEKAARGDRDQREYPWGDTFDSAKCNCLDLGLKQTTPVGIFAEGASPYGCLDMSGNVWEWTRSLWGKNWEKPDFAYPYFPSDGREDINAGDNVRRVLRGGSFDVDGRALRCSYRSGYDPDSRYNLIGFRLVIAPE